jgi:hypothetical protein
MEAMIASQLEPEQFGSYMALGDTKAAAEQLMFMEINGGFGTFFDWDFADKKCIPHSDGRPKRSLYLSVYRALENIPLDAMSTLYLVTKDGRSLAIEKGDYTPPLNWTGYALYREYCPMSPLAVSTLDPKNFGDFLTDPLNKVHAPTIFFADLAAGNPDDIENSGNVGQIYNRNLEHLKECIHSLQSGKGKMTKIVDRSNFSTSFYQIIDNGFYAATQDGLVMYAFPSREELKKKNYDWAKSSQIF